MHTIEIHFWRVVNPLMNRSAGVRWFIRSVYGVSRPVIGVSERIIESPFDILFLAMIVFVGSAAFGFGYLIGLWLG